MSVYALSRLFGFMLRLSYDITGNYIIALLLFAAVFKAAVFPLILAAQKNSIRLCMLQPELSRIKRTHYGDKERVNEESYKLYKRERYSPISAIAPLLIQIALLFCIMPVIRNPGEHIKDAGFNAVYAGFDLTGQPFSGGVLPYIIIAFITGISSYILCLIQNRLNPAQRRMPFWGKWGMSVVIIAFSVYFPLVMPGGIGLYWFFSNTLSIAAAFCANAVYNPVKLLPAQLLVPPPKISRHERKRKRERERDMLARAKESAKRFYAFADTNKLVFYSVSGGQYKYYSELIDYILAQTNITVHYITNDPQDNQLLHTRERFESYFIGERQAVAFMLRLRGVCMVIMTAPNLGTYHIKRSVADLDIEYVYTYHHFTSLMLLREGALDNFDTVLCVGPHQIEEIKRTEKLYSLPPKKLIKCGYGQMDKLLRAYIAPPDKAACARLILIAPTWSFGNILDSHLSEILSLLTDYRVVIRAHPEYIKRFGENYQALKNEHKAQNITFDEDFLSDASVYQSDILITDWSNIAYEFSYATKRPVIFINTPMKVLNGSYHKLDITPIDVTLRDMLGVSVDTKNLAHLPDIITDMQNNPDKYSRRVNEAIERYLFYPGRSGEAGGRYIISRLKEKR